MSNDRLSIPQIPNMAAVMAEGRARDLERQAENAGRFDADLVFKYLMKRVNDFQRGLKEDQEIGLQLANFGLAAELHIRAIGYKNRTYWSSPD